MSRGGQAKSNTAPERRCIATGAVLPKADLIRFVAGPDGQVVPDLAGKLPGRGLWVRADRAALETAVKKNLFARAAKAPLQVPDGLIELVETGLTRRLTDLIALSRKGGRAVAGYEKARSWVQTGEAVLLMQASDGSARGKTKLRPPDGKDSVFEVLTASELGLSFGREHVIHAAFAAGGLTEHVREAALRLSGVRGSVEMTGGGSATGKAKKTV